MSVSQPGWAFNHHDCTQAAASSWFIVAAPTWFLASTAGPAPGVGDSAVSRYSRGATCRNNKHIYTVFICPHQQQYTCRLVAL